MAADKELHKLFEYYIEHQDYFVRKYNGRAIVLVGNKVVGDFDSEWEAASRATLEHEPGKFLVQYVSPGPSAYTVTVASSMVQGR